MSLRAYFRAELARLFGFIISPGSKVLEVVLPNAEPLLGRSHNARTRVVMNGRAVPSLGKFDCVVMPDVLDGAYDCQALLESAKKSMHSRSRLVLTYYNHLWEPLVRLAERLGIKRKAIQHNWLSDHDMERFLHLTGFDIITKGSRLLVPAKLPLFSYLCNRYLSGLPLFRRLCFINYIVARPLQPGRRNASVSIVIPTWNEAGTIERAVTATPVMGAWTELLFVDNHSTDGTRERVEEMIRKHKDKRIRLIMQKPQKGKGVAVRQGFDEAKGDILMILDSDLTVAPEELPKFYDAIVSGRGEFINGSRLVYPMEKQSMRSLNYVANKFFSMAFTWLLGQRVKDTLCGTKVLWKKDYERIKAGRSYFGDFDPFGDFDLLFGAAKQNLKIVDLPIRYKARQYGEIKIRRWQHGLLLVRMCIYAYRKLKLF